MINDDKIYYSLCAEEIRVVAKERYDMELADDEIDCIGKKIGDAIDWYEIIADLIGSYLFDKEWEANRP